MCWGRIVPWYGSYYIMSFLVHISHHSSPAYLTCVHVSHHSSPAYVTRTGHEVYVVGGSVRDVVMGNAPKDLDLLTTATVQQVWCILVFVFWYIYFGEYWENCNYIEDCYIAVLAIVMVGHGCPTMSSPCCLHYTCHHSSLLHT